MHVEFDVTKETTTTLGGILSRWFAEGFNGITLQQAHVTGKNEFVLNPMVVTLSMQYYAFDHRHFQHDWIKVMTEELDHKFLVVALQGIPNGFTLIERRIPWAL